MNLNNEHNIEYEKPLIPPRVRGGKKKKKPIIKLLTVLASCIAIICITFGSLYNVTTVSGEKESYYSEEFSEGAQKWQGADMHWQESFQDRNGVLMLAQEKFVTPYSMLFLPSEGVPEETFVFHYTFNVSKFRGEATTLSTLVFPTTTLAVVVNDEGKIGIARDLFVKPTYSEKLLGGVEQNTWEDIYVYIDGKEDKIQVYHGSKRVIDEKWEDPAIPVQEVWLGSIWLEGAGHYGAANQIAYDNVELGNKALLPKPAFSEFVTTVISDSFTEFKNKLF